MENCGFTVETLRKHLVTIIEANDKRYSERFDAQSLSVSAALAAADRAVQKSEMAAEKRFEGVNEFRASLADQQRTLMPRAEAEIRMQALSDRIDAVQLQLKEREGVSSGVRSGWAWAIGAAGLVATIVAIFYTLVRSK